jgi:hypothetical protein
MAQGEKNRDEVSQNKQKTIYKCLMHEGIKRYSLRSFLSAILDSYTFLKLTAILSSQHISISLSRFLCTNLFHFLIPMPCDHAVMGSSPRNNLLKKCRERLYNKTQSGHALRNRELHVSGCP